MNKKIHAEYDHTQPPGTDVLARVAAGQLRIYANRAAYDALKEPLEEDLLIGTLGGSKKNALIVEVPTQRHVDTVWKELKPLVPDEKRQRTEAVDPRHLNELNALVAIAHKLSGAKELKLETLLDTPMTIFGAAFDDGLYVRQEYWDLHEIIQKRLASDSSLRRILVVGSPGIGKSVFGVFLLLLFMMEKKHVAYRPLAHPRVHYFTWSSTNGYAVSDTSRAGITYEGFI
ncbi:unnamed protein product [Phytophthora lilii]|uniref:Unnamed protein product n=1 Tax=Phytophthora lilii TaxID=2077276 RepID=A0A9W7CVH3_9STRA|nr:unnamed protein product [Phytophthora lilii]